jgi:hypothetical protein
MVPPRSRERAVDYVNPGAEFRPSAAHYEWQLFNTLTLRLLDQ